MFRKRKRKKRVREWAKGREKVREGWRKTERGENLLVPGTVESSPGSPLQPVPGQPGGCEGHQLRGSADEAHRSD